ncbi:MAG: phosphoglycerate mutase family protein [Aeriscardovia sp.]|nr:phosphoglycerate mutase family protein [Aeriscardovia sp.]MBO5633494.1 phosphoglycerate mutase family protein [Aeriscardovia sp.]
MLLHLFLVRHGQTYFNRYNRMQGWSNSPLTDKGQQDALHAAQALHAIHFSAAYSSDMTRAEQTARTILRKNETASENLLCVSPYFREQFYGYFEGQDINMSWYAVGAPHGAKTYQDIVNQYGLAATKDFMKEADPFHDAENNYEYWERIQQGFRLIAHDAQSFQQSDSDHNILIVTHSNTLMNLIQRFNSKNVSIPGKPQNGSVTIATFDTDKDFAHSIEIDSYTE